MWCVATGGTRARLVRGTALRFEAGQPGSTSEGLRLHARSLDPAALGVGFVHSALEGRWGGAAVLADLLIVRADHPILRDDARADRLVRDLRGITRAFRAENGLPEPDPGASRQDARDLPRARHANCGKETSLQ